MVRKHHRLNEQELEQTLGTMEDRGALSLPEVMGCKELNMTSSY